MAKKQERGSYRAIAVVLLDGKDFHRLPERARWVFVALKLNLGPSGIEVHYPAALAHQLAAQTGMPAEAVMQAMDTLEAEGWIQREANVIWVVEQLRFDPHLNLADEKHRTSIQNHIKSLPRLSIVDAFIVRYAAWMDLDIAPARPCEGSSEGLPRASLLPSSEPENEPEPEKQPESEGAAVEEAARKIIMAANAGMGANLAIERYTPIPLSHGSRSDVIGWIKRGIPPDFIEEVVHDTAMTFRVSDRNRQINSMVYFTNRVIDEYEKRMAADGKRTGKNGGGNAVGSSVREDKYDAITITSPNAA